MVSPLSPIWPSSRPLTTLLDFYHPLTWNILFVQCVICFGHPVFKVLCFCVLFLLLLKVPLRDVSQGLQPLRHKDHWKVS